MLSGLAEPIKVLGLLKGGLEYLIRVEPTEYLFTNFQKLARIDSVSIVDETSTDKVRTAKAWRVGLHLGLDLSSGRRIYGPLHVFAPRPKKGTDRRVGGLDLLRRC